MLNAEELDFLEDEIPGFLPAFPQTGNLGHNELTPGLRPKDTHHPVMIPVSQMEPVEKVGSSFGPQFEGAAEDFSFKVQRESATDVPIKRMTLFLRRPTGPPRRIQVRARINRRNITRGDVEMAVAMWMTEMLNQAPPDIISQPIPLQSSFDQPAVPLVNVWVWMWRGLTQKYDEENTWEVLL